MLIENARRIIPKISPEVKKLQSQWGRMNAEERLKWQSFTNYRNALTNNNKTTKME